MSEEESPESPVHSEESEGEDEMGGEDVVDEKADFIHQALHTRDEDVFVPGIKDILWSIFKQLTVGVDLTKVILPVELCESRGILEKLTDILTHVNFGFDILYAETPEDRILGLCKFAVSGWYVRAHGAKKPINPVLGEFFRARWIMEDGSITTYFAEQVSHHPPISAFFGENRQSNVEMEGFYNPQSKFLGNSAAAIGAGHAFVRYKNLNEVYQLTWPDYYFRGLFFGTLKVELGGKMEITCEQTGWSATIQFKQKPFWGGQWYRIQGKIMNPDGEVAHYISGKWTEQLFIQHPIPGRRKAKTEQEIFFDPFDAVHPPIQFIPKDKLTEFESQRLWHDLSQAIVDGDLAAARDAKQTVEEAQREARREREEAGEEFRTQFFQRDDPQLPFWTFHGREDPLYLELLQRRL